MRAVHLYRMGGPACGQYAGCGALYAVNEHGQDVPELVTCKKCLKAGAERYLSWAELAGLDPADAATRELWARATDPATSPDDAGQRELSALLTTREPLTELTR